jgi:hypothetical protein
MQVPWANSTVLYALRNITCSRFFVSVMCSKEIIHEKLLYAITAGAGFDLS